MKSMPEKLLLLVLGAAAGAAAMHWGTSGVDIGDQPGAAAGGRAILYWVAPMDPNYRRDQPGKSPMGMDLVPVYADGGTDLSPGTVRILPDVVNNLGVRTARATRRALPGGIRTVGYVRYDEDQLTHIHPRVEGWIERLYVKAEGDPIKRGQPLYDLYSPQLVNAQEELLLALRRDNQRLVQAARDRLLALQIPAQTIASLEQRRVVQQTVTFPAPRSGVVDNMNVREGFYVSPGTMLMSVGGLEDVWVEAEVFERQAARVAVGQPVTMTLDYLPGRSWRGQVDYVYPSLDEDTRTLRVRLRFANPLGELKPNMFAQVVIASGHGADTLVVPREALIRTGAQQRVVLALGEGRFKSVAVTIGAVGEEYVQVLTGLAEGDEVVVSAQFLLDSESSRTSDFRRMHHGDTDHSAMGHGELDHNEMDHGEMDHGEMEPRDMDHSGMGHGQADHSGGGQ